MRRHTHLPYAVLNACNGRSFNVGPHCGFQLVAVSAAAPLNTGWWCTSILLVGVHLHASDCRCDWHSSCHMRDGAQCVSSVRWAKRGNGRKLPPSSPLFALQLVPTFCTPWLCGGDAQGLRHTRSSRDSLVSLRNCRSVFCPLVAAVCSLSLHWSCG